MQELIDRINNNDPTLTAVELANSNMDVSLCMTICLALVKNKYVKHLDLSNNPLKVDGWRILSKMLRLNTSLVSLNLQNSLQESNSRNSYSFIKVSLLDSLIDSQLCLEKLDLSENGTFEEQESVKLVKLLLTKPNFRSLNLAGILDGRKINITELSTAFAENSQLAHICLDRLDFDYFEQAQHEMLLKSLFDKDSPIISLQNCYINSERMLKLMVLVKKAKGRNISLDVTNNSVGGNTDFAFDFALVLAEITNLYSLKLGSGHFEKFDFAALRHGLMQNRSLREIAISKNSEVDNTMATFVNILLQKRRRDDFVVLLLTLNQLVDKNQLNTDLWQHIIGYLDFPNFNKTIDEKQACAKLILEENHTSLKTKLRQLPTNTPLVKEKAAIGKNLFYFFDQEKTASVVTKKSDQITKHVLKL